jgi:hypothetical protein
MSEEMDSTVDIDACQQGVRSWVTSVITRPLQAASPELAGGTVACLVSWSFSWFNLGKQCFLVVGVSAAVVWTAAHFSPQNSKSPALEVRGWESAAQQPRSLSRRQPDPERKSFARGIAVEAELALPAGRRIGPALFFSKP